MIRLISVVGCIALSACATTIDELPGTITLRGQTFETVTRTFETDSGRTYSRTTVFVGGERFGCIPGDVRDCETALSELRSRRFTP